MAGVEQGIGIIDFKSLSQSRQFFFCLLSVKQVEATDNGMDGPRTCCKDVLQSTMSTACK